jgi:hypothetical protein
MTRHIWLCRCYELSKLLAVLVLCASACAATTSSTLSPRQRSALIEQLQGARETDLENAKDIELGPIAAGDYMIQADKAQKAIADLNRSDDVPQAEISDALFVPPKHLTPAMRASLIQQLEQAKALDDRRYLENLGGREPILTEDFNIQSIRATRVIDDLETETPVSWFDIRQAMYVPLEMY